MPELVKGSMRDLSSTSVCTLSYNLRILELRGFMDLSLFPRHDSIDVPWPNLITLVVMFWPVSPSGAWYFIGPDSEGTQRHTPLQKNTIRYSSLIRMT